MPTAILPRILPTSYPVSQLVVGLSSTLLSCLKKTEETYEKVYVHKLDANGIPRTFSILHPITQQPYFTDILPYITNKNTGEIYLDEPAFVIAQKSAVVLLGLPLYAIGVISWHLHQIWYSISIIAQRVFERAYPPFSLGNFFVATQILDEEIRPLSAIIEEQFFEIIRAPLFAMSCGIAALLGIIRPFQGRECVSMISKAWHRGATYKDDIRKMTTHRTENDCMSECRDLLHSGRVLHLAYCFLSRGNLLSDRPLQVVRRESLGPYFG